MSQANRVVAFVQAIDQSVGYNRWDTELTRLIFTFQLCIEVIAKRLLQLYNSDNGIIQLNNDISFTIYCENERLLIQQWINGINKNRDIIIYYDQNGYFIEMRSSYGSLVLPANCPWYALERGIYKLLARCPVIASNGIDESHRETAPFYDGLLRQIHSILTE